MREEISKEEWQNLIGRRRKVREIKCKIGSINLKNYKVNQVK